MTTKIDVFDGNIGIGTTDPGSYRLRVEGGIKAASINVAGVANAHIPTGFILLWSGLLSAIPTGWTICDGQNGTPDLRDRFVRGANGDTNVGQEGGADSITLTDDQLPQHAHNHQVDSANHTHSHNSSTKNCPHAHNSNNSGNHGHNMYGISWRRLPGWDNYNVPGTGYAIQATNNMNDGTEYGPGVHTHYIWAHNSNHAHNGQNSNANHSHTANMANAGNSASITITNPYYALYYMMKL
jgi:hypothetical protein